MAVDGDRHVGIAEVRIRDLDNHLRAGGLREVELLRQGHGLGALAQDQVLPVRDKRVVAKHRPGLQRQRTRGARGEQTGGHPEYHLPERNEAGPDGIVTMCYNLIHGDAMTDRWHENWRTRNEVATSTSK